MSSKIFKYKLQYATKRWNAANHCTELYQRKRYSTAVENRHVEWGLSRNERSSLCIFCLRSRLLLHVTICRQPSNKSHIFCGRNSRLCKGHEVISKNHLSHSAVVSANGRFLAGWRTDLHFLVRGSCRESSRELTSPSLALGAVWSGRNYSPVHQH